MSSFIPNDPKTQLAINIGSIPRKANVRAKFRSQNIFKRIYSKLPSEKLFFKFKLKYLNILTWEASCRHDLRYNPLQPKDVLCSCYSRGGGGAMLKIFYLLALQFISLNIASHDLCIVIYVH